MMISRSVAVGGLILLLAGCAAPTRMTLTPEQRGKITELKARVTVVQDEVIAAVQPSNVSVATGGGLIGAMIDSSITNSRVKASQEVLGPFYAVIEDIDYRKEFNESIGRQLARYPIKVADVVTTPRTLRNEELARMRDELQANQALLLIVPRYYLTMDFRNLDVETVVTMWTKEGGSSGRLAGLVERGVLYYQSQSVGPGGAASVSLWGADNAARYLATVRESIVETMNLVLMDIDVKVPEGKEPPRSYAFNTGQAQGQIKGQLITESAERVVILGENKKLYSLPRSSIAVAGSTP